MHKQSSKSGFTLIEIMITVIIVGVVASLALPQFSNLIERSYCTHAQRNLLTIHHAAAIYILKNTTYPDLTNLNDINTTFKLNLRDTRFVYDFDGKAGTYRAEATRDNGPAVYTWTMSNLPLSSGNPTLSDPNFCESIIAAAK